MSTPVTSSVIVCSTWIRGLTSMKYNSFVSASTRNSTVPALSYLTARPIAIAASQIFWRTSLRQVRRMGDFHHLLVSPLDGAVPLP